MYCEGGGHYAIMKILFYQVEHCYPNIFMIALWKTPNSFAQR